MKKIFWLLMPSLICIAILFAIQNREFSSKILLETIQNWRFDDGMELLRQATNTFRSISTKWISTAFDNNILLNIIKVVTNIGTTIVLVITGIGQLFATVFAFLNDLLNNISQIVEYIYGGFRVS